MLKSLNHVASRVRDVVNHILRHGLSLGITLHYYEFEPITYHVVDNNLPKCCAHIWAGQP